MAAPAVLALILPLLVAAMLAGAWLASRPIAPPSKPLPGVPYPLLGTPPKPLRWSAEALPSDLTHDEAGRSLRVHAAEDAAIVPLGDSRDALEYSFEVTIEQTPWTGNVGIFFGYHDVKTPTSEFSRYQTIQLKPSFEVPGTFTLGRSVEALMRPTQDIQSQFLARSTGRKLAPGPHTLAITIGASGLEEVRLDGEKVPGLADTPNPAEHLTKADDRGPFGVINFGNTSAYRKAAFLRHVERPHDPSK